MSGIMMNGGHLSLFWALPQQSHRAGKLVPYLRLYQPGLGDPHRLSPTQLMDPPKLLFHMNGWSWLMLHNILNPLKYARAGLMSPRNGSSSHLRFTAWLRLGKASPAEVAAI